MKQRIGLGYLCGGLLCGIALTGCMTREVENVERPAYGPDGLPLSWVNPPREDVLTREFTPSPRAPLVSMGSDGRLVYKPFSDRGDRMIDFSTAGYKRNEEPIPTIGVVKTLSPPEGEPRTIENMKYVMGPDSSETIQAALDEVAAMEPDENGFRGAVLLKKGTWYLTRGLQVRSGVVLRGEGDGEDGTILMANMPSGRGTVIHVGGGGGTSSRSNMPLSGELVERTLEGKTVYGIKLKDEQVFNVRKPGFSHDYDFSEFVGENVVITLPLITSTQGDRKTYSLKHNMPYTLRAMEEGEAESLPPEGMVLVKEELPGSRIADAYVPTGASQITVEDASLFEVGDLVNVVKTTNDDWIEVLGVGQRLRHIRAGKEGAKKRPWTPQNYSHVRTITAIEGNTLTLDVMMPQSIQAEHGGGIVRKAVSTLDTLCGAENLRIVSNYDETQTSNSKSANYANIRAGVSVKAKDAWVRDVTVLHSWYAAVQASGARFVTIRDCTSLQPVGAKRGENGIPSRSGAETMCSL